MHRALYPWNDPAIKRKLMFGIAMLCIAIPTIADRQPGSLSTVKINAATGNVEIIHRLHNHDAELGIIAVLEDRSLSMDQLVGRAQLALYVEDRFTLAATNGDAIGAPLDLELLGAELDGEYVLVYQEFSGEFPTTIAVRNDILRDVFPEQVNHVNIALGGGVRSLTFKERDRWHRTSLE
ncbi:MAG: DUF6702 family protein [Woeseiaceae bacterium]